MFFSESLLFESRIFPSEYVEPIIITINDLSLGFNNPCSIICCGTSFEYQLNDEYLAPAFEKFTNRKENFQLW